ncbi:MAG: magnesium transporter [Gammaproteobacteria bacterium]|jgi:magnesium transporter
MEYFDKTYHPPGTAAGTLITSDVAVPEDLTIRLIHYTENEISEKASVTSEQCRPSLTEKGLTWVHLQGSFMAETIKEIGRTFELHPLALEDILNKGQRPKTEEYDDLLFVIMTMPCVINEIVTIQQVSIFMRDNYIVSFHNGDEDPFEPLRRNLRKSGSRIRHQHADYLLYAMLDLLIDLGYPMLEEYGNKIEAIEEQLLSESISKTTLTDIHRIRHDLILLRRNLWPQREVIRGLLRNDGGFIKESTLLYLRDCYDHTIQILELMENYREMATSMLDIYVSSTSNHLSEVMRVLTMIATVFIPLTFVVGLYGMNFSHADSPWAMPELHWYYGYPIVLVIMLTITVGMLIYFKKKKWL